MLNLRRRFGQSIRVMEDGQQMATITLLRRVEYRVALFVSFGDKSQQGVECLIERGRAFNIRFGASTVSIRAQKIQRGELALEIDAPAHLLLLRGELIQSHVEALIERRSIAEVHQHV